MEGGCHCGAIRFKAISSPFWVGACYCVDCRKISGAPYLVYAGFKTDEVEFLRGVPKKYSSSENVWRSFCEFCGSPSWFTYKNSGENIFISIGAFDDPSSFVPKKHIWTSQKLPWVTISDDLPQREQ